MSRKDRRGDSGGGRTPRAGRWGRLVFWLALLIVVGIVLVIWIRQPREPQRSRSSEQGPVPATALQAMEDETVFAAYAQSSTCRECHPDAYEAWATSNHGLAERPLTEGQFEAFDPEQVIEHGKFRSTARKSGAEVELLTQVRSMEPEAVRPVRVIGVDPLIQFLVPFPKGRLQATELAYDPHHHDWFNIFGGEDRRPGEWGHWTGRGMNWNSMCATCHNTRLRKHYQPENDSYQTTMAEMSVACEACHGPMEKHVDWQRRHRGREGDEDPTLHKVSREAMLAVCGSCHSRRAELTGEFVPGHAYFDHHALTIPDDTEIFYPDGQIHEEDYEFTSFLGSKMYDAGVSCTDCHEPHSNRLRAQGNQLCMTCHGPPVPPAPLIDPVAHSHHPEGSLGNQCVECHMPHTTYMQRHPRRDHGFIIPDPLLTIEHGVPNACNRCHTEETAEWALAAVEEWYGERMDRPSRRRAMAMADLREGKAAAVPVMRDISETDSNAVWRASAALMLGGFLDEPLVLDTLIGRTKDPEPLVRGMAVRALEPAVAVGHPGASGAVEPLLQDPVRSVRVEAAWAGRREVDPDSLAGKDLRAYLEHTRDQPSGLMQWGSWHFDRGNPREALPFLKQAREWDPNSAPIHHGVAVVESALSNPEAAVDALRKAVQLAPEEGEYYYKLGLALNETGDLSGATEALERATRLDPQRARAWYNLGLAYAAQERLEESVAALNQAETADAQFVDAAYAAATVFARMNRLAEARQAAQRALEMDPGHAGARAILGQLRR